MLIEFIQQHEFRPEDKYLILMSDGIFEFISNEEVVEFVHKHATQGMTPREVANSLPRVALSGNAQTATRG